MKASLIISVYKDTKSLKAVLDSVEVQSWKDFEIIVSEDGDSNEIKNFLSSYPFVQEWQHLTQEDLGWRKNRALNRAALAAKTDYLVFIDGDCVLHPRFMEMHHRYAKAGRILAGKRIKLNQSLTEELINQKTTTADIQSLLSSKFFKLKELGCKFPEEGLFLDPDGLAGIVPRFRRMSQLKGCNMSFSKKALYAINGFDEDYNSPAIGEDIDLGWRFKKVGYTLFSLRNLAVQYHLYHSENWSDQSMNVRLMEENIRSNQYVCRNGIVKESD